MNAKGEDAAAIRHLFFTLGHPIFLKYRQQPDTQTNLAEAQSPAELRQAEIHSPSSQLAETREAAAQHDALQLAATLQLELTRVATVRNDAAALGALEERFTGLRAQAQRLEKGL